MAFYQDRIYPYVVHWLGNPKPILELRRQIVPLAQGKVLEIGVGSGANFVHYDVAKVTTLYALEPNPEMLQLAERERRRTKLSPHHRVVPMVVPHISSRTSAGNRIGHGTLLKHNGQRWCALASRNGGAVPKLLSGHP